MRHLRLYISCLQRTEMNPRFATEKQRLKSPKPLITVRMLQRICSPFFNRVRTLDTQVIKDDGIAYLKDGF